MQKISRYLGILLAVCIFSACGKKDEALLPELDLSIAAVETVADEEPPPAESDEPLQIKWGWGYMLSSNAYTPFNAKIITDLNEKFGVALKLVYVSPFDEPNSETTADIFMEMGSTAQSAGLTRAIPRAMIERYAPRYADMLSREPYGWEINKTSGQEAYTGLNLYDSEFDALQVYSIYRLDWLDYLGIAPNGPVTEIRDGIYFTDAAFTQAQFADIMHRFTYDDPDQNGVSDTTGMCATGVSNLMNLFDLRLTMNENEKTTVWYASDAFKDYAVLTAALFRDGVIQPPGEDGDEWGAFLNGHTGWFTGGLIQIGYMEINGIKQLFERHPAAKLLITPPGAGVLGQGGVMMNSAFPFEPDYHWAVGAEVTDEKLAKILEIFDALAFDRENWVLVRYGYEGGDYTWEGEPYESRVIQSQEKFRMALLDRGIYFFNTFIFDGEAGRHLYDLGTNALTEFAVSSAGRQLMRPPYKEDPAGVYADRLQLFREKYGYGLAEAVQAYIEDLASGRADAETGWETYLAKLDTCGLQEYLVLVDQYPVVTP